MSAEGGQLLLPLLSFIINSNVPPKVVVSNWGAIGMRQGNIRDEEEHFFLQRKTRRLGFFGGGGLLSSFHHFGISQSLVLLRLTFS